MAGKEYIPSKGVRSKTNRAGIEGMGYTCWLTRERMKANNIKLIVVVAAAAAVVVIVEFSFLKNNYCGSPLRCTLYFSIEVPPSGLAPCFLSGKVFLLKLRCWPSSYNNNGSRLILPQNLLKNRALA